VQIACEKCGTHYVLDDGLVPPGGAPVQCSRCGHVFTANAAVPAKAATQFLEKPASAPLPPPRAATEVFGASATGPKGRSPTQVFGSLPTERKATQPFGFAAAEPPPQKVAKGGDWTLLLVCALLMGVVGTFALKVWNQHQADVKERKRDEVERAFLLVRRDDASARARSIEALEGLSHQPPVRVEAQADLVVALALARDDARVAKGSLEEKGEIFQARIARLEQERAPNDWETRVNALLEQLTLLKHEREAFSAQETASQDRASAAYQVLPAAQANAADADKAAVVRARAVYEAIAGSSEAVALIERYRRMNVPDGWAEVALAEYALNARGVPETLQEARKGLNEVISRDSTFLRAYVLLARISLREKKWDLAASALDIIVLLNPAHTLAQKLLVWAQDDKQREGLSP
jgi:predicted Zn finger-like uncharacterized protein